MRKTAILVASGIFLAAFAGAAVSVPAHAQTSTTSDSKPAKTTKTTPGRQAFFARERACAAEWKADKAAGKVAAGMKWPKYLSACNKRKKAEGM